MCVCVCVCVGGGVFVRGYIYIDIYMRVVASTAAIDIESNLYFGDVVF